MDRIENTNWGQSVTGVVIRDHKVILAKHTYGNGKGLFIIPGGYVNYGESPQEALKREYLEEVNIVVEPKHIIGIRFNSKEWYVAFYAEYVSGNIQSDHMENDEVVWMDINDVFESTCVPELTKSLIKCALSTNGGLSQIPYEGKNPPNSLFGIE